ncbi:MAG: phosphodiester glycosidase family protein [Abditibacteriota bacterium]|nr:phosphodiester glycosidase family protein [Abditibacteriota bacterium]
MKKILITLILIIVAINLFAYSLEGKYDWTKPTKRIYPGIDLASVALEDPFVNVYCVKIDLKQGFKFYTTPPLTEEENFKIDERETWKETTRTFMRNFQNSKRQMLVAINADFFRPWPPKNASDPAWLVGMAVSEGKLVSVGHGEPCFVWKKDGTVSLDICDENYDISNVMCAVAGNSFFLFDGTYRGGDAYRLPRTCLGVSLDHHYMYWMVVDGRRHRSEGMSMEDCAKAMLYFGAAHAINLDGGGSSTMCFWDRVSNDDDKCKLINEPNQGEYRKGTLKSEDAKFKVGERKVANNLGVYIDL